MATMAKRITAAAANRIPAKLSGGRSRSPSLMASQVEPQMAHSPSHTTNASRTRTCLEGTASVVGWGAGSTAELGSVERAAEQGAVVILRPAVQDRLSIETISMLTQLLSNIRLLL